MTIAPKSRVSRAPSTHEWRQPGTPNGELFTKTDSETGDVTTYYYDGLGNLLSVDLPDGRLIEYVIDGQNRRIGKKVDGVLTKAWLYKDQLKPVAEMDGSGNLTARFVYGSKTNVPDVVMKYNAGLLTTYRVISDHLGSPIMAVNVNNSADVPFKAEYSAFGERTVTTDAASEDWMPFGFAGGMYDADTGLTRFGARDFDPVIGRWTAKDPIRWDGRQWNTYVYIGNDSLNSTDPYGTDSWWSTVSKWAKPFNRARTIYGICSELAHLGFPSEDELDEREDRETQCAQRGIPLAWCCRGADGSVEACTIRGCDPALQQCCSPGCGDQ